MHVKRKPVSHKVCKNYKTVVGSLEDDNDPLGTGTVPSPS